MNVSGCTFKVYFITFDHAVSHAATRVSQRETSQCRTQPVKQCFGFIKRVFYYRNKCSNSGPDNFVLNKDVGLLTVGFISRNYCI